MKQMIDDLRKEYLDVTGNEPAIRWNKPTLRKKITDAQILKAGHEAMEKSKSQAPIFDEVKPDFEALAGDTQKTLPNEAGSVDDDQQPAGDGRGGPREGAGRPVGQTDRRAWAERVMSLEVPDLGVSMIVDGLNSGLQKVTGLGIDDKPVTTDLFGDMPHGSKSMALGLTKLLYFWFPSLEGRTDVVTLHLESLFLIINPFRERAERLSQLIKQQQNKETNNVEEKNSQTQSAPAPASVPASVPAGPGHAGKKRITRSRSHSK